jgi:hypothetical protein
MAGEAAAASTGLPPLSLSAGPSQASGSSGGTTGTGAFYFNQPETTLFQQLVPFAILGVMAWAIFKR